MTPQAAAPETVPRVVRTPTEDLLVRAALAVSSVRGDHVFVDLVRGLADLLEVDGAFIALRVPGAPTTLQMLAFRFDGQMQENFAYDISGTPCAHVVGVQYRGHDPDHSIMYARGLQALFPGDETFVRMGLESYAGYPLNAADGSLLGLMSVASRRPMEDPNLVESMVKIFAVRAAAALERARATEALRESEASYRAIFEASEDAIFVHDWDTGRVLDASPKASELYGYTREELLRLRLADVSAEAPPFDAGRAAELIRQAKADSAPVRFEWRARHRDGHVMWHEVTLKRAAIAGEPRVLAFVRDITARKAADAALRASEEQYRTIFNASVDGLLVKDADHRVVDVNEAYLAMHGYRREDLLGQRLSEFIPPELQARCEVLMPRILEGEPCHLEAWSRRRDGSSFEVEIHGVPMRYGGQPHALVMMRDITEAKRAEAALRASEEQYRAIFNASAETLVLRDEAFRVVDVNPAYEAVSGYPRTDVLGSDRIVGNPPETEARVREIHRRALAGEATQVETRIVRSDGSEVDIELRGVPVRYRGRPHVLYAGRDISARKRADAVRAELEAQLRQAQKMEAIGQLTGGIAHDFNNILTSAMGYIGLAGERPAASADAKLDNYLEQARKACRRARDLIQQMLTFSRGGSGPAAPVQLAPLLGEAEKLLHSTLPATVALEIDAAPGLPPIMADPVQIEQALLNLCINARDAMGGAGSLKVRLERRYEAGAVCASCRQRVAGDHVEIAVRDDGPGIPAAVLDRIFEPFFTTKQVGRGSGMGLAMVHGIVHRHGGHVVVESELGRGTRFRILFPALDPAEGLDSSAHPVEARIETAPVVLRGCALVVDDEESISALLREILESCGLRVQAASDPGEALRAIDARPVPFDLVVTDLTMPGTTGIALARELRRRAMRGPVLLLTGYGEGLTEQELRESGITALLAKPVEPRALVATVRELLTAAVRAA